MQNLAYGGSHFDEYWLHFYITVGHDAVLSFLFTGVVVTHQSLTFDSCLCRYSLKSIDPVLMAPTCVFLASKVEVAILSLWCFHVIQYRILLTYFLLFYFLFFLTHSPAFLLVKEFGVVSNTRLISAATSVCK